MAKKSKAFGAKRKSKGSKLNPFDLKFQRKRHDVLGSKKNGANSTPLGTRKIAHETRKGTIGKELRLLTKKNKINDKRLGQQNPNLTAAQKAELRFVAQRKHQFGGKKSKFLLNDDEDNLEHLASGLTEAEKFQRGKGSEANVDEELDPELMAQASFGGGTLEEGGKRISRQDLIKQAIERSVQAKALKRRDREIQFDQWEKLDEQFTELKEAGKLTFGRVDLPKEDGDDEYMELYQQLGEVQRVPAKREWANELTRRDAEVQEAKELKRIQSQKQTLFKSGEQMTFPMAVDQISATRIRNSLDLAQLLLVCHDAAVFLEENRRYCPEVVGFLLNTLMIANETDNSKHENLLSNFPTEQNFLYFGDKSGVETISPLSISSLKEAKAVDDLNKDRLLDLQVLKVTVRLVRFFAQLYTNIFEAYPVIFEQFQTQLERLPVSNYPADLNKEVAGTLEIVSDQIKQRSKITHLHKTAAQKIKMIDTFEPRIEQHFNARHPTHKRDDPNANVKRMKKRLKKEIRGTVKELRQDSRFIAGEQARVRRQVDEERQKKTNRIMASLQVQESEYKKRKGKKF
ncbi:hypothetical protein M3Y97_00458300 [Aphelenchoides bicaudatus]|nr:hypothetical protein M3Y97_00458300 [Aphelenchoides bicaudatus]